MVWKRRIKRKKTEDKGSITGVEEKEWRKMKEIQEERRERKEEEEKKDKSEEKLGKTLREKWSEKEKAN